MGLLFLFELWTGVLPHDIWIDPAGKWRQSFEGAIEKTSEKAQSPCSAQVSLFDETLLGLTIFLLSFPRARTPSKCEGDRKAFGYPGNLRYESIAAGARPLRKALAYLRAIGTFQRIHRSTRSGRGRSNSGPGVCF
jgi:hypothetical protein